MVITTDFIRDLPLTEIYESEEETLRGRHRLMEAIDAFNDEDEISIIEKMVVKTFKKFNRAMVLRAISSLTPEKVADVIASKSFHELVIKSGPESSLTQGLHAASGDETRLFIAQGYGFSLRAWFNFGMDGDLAHEIVQFAHSDECLAAFPKIEEIDEDGEETSTITPLSTMVSCYSVSGNYGPESGYRGLFGAFQSGAYHWIADFLDSADRLSYLFFRAIIAASALEIELGLREVKAIVDPSGGVMRSEVFERKLQASQDGITIMPQEEIMSRILAIPEIVADDHNALLARTAKRKNGSGYDESLILAKGTHKQMEIFSSRADARNILTIISEGTSGPFALRVFFGLVSLITRDILAKGLSIEEAKTHESVITWEMIAKEIKWDRHHVATHRLRKDITRMSEFLGTTQIRIRTTNSETGEEYSYKTNIIPNTTLDKSDGNSNDVFQIGRFKLGDFFIESIFRKNDKVPAAYFDANNIYSGGGFNDYDASNPGESSVASKNSDLYTRLSVFVDRRTTAAVRNRDITQTAVIDFNAAEVSEEVGIRHTAGPNASRQANYDARLTQRERIEKMLKRMRENGHIEDYEIIRIRGQMDQYRVTAGKRMVSWIAAIVAAEKNANQERRTMIAKSMEAGKKGRKTLRLTRDSSAD